jgi:hypothetical protein
MFFVTPTIKKSGNLRYENRRPNYTAVYTEFILEKGLCVFESWTFPSNRVTLLHNEFHFLEPIGLRFYLPREMGFQSEVTLRYVTSRRVSTVSN